MKLSNSFNNVNKVDGRMKMLRNGLGDSEKLQKNAIVKNERCG